MSTARNDNPGEHELTLIKNANHHGSSSNTGTAPLHYQAAADDNNEHNRPSIPSSPVEGRDLELDIDDAIELLGMGSFQRRILWAAGLCFAADSMEVLLLSFLSIVLQAEWGLSEEKTASITSAVFIGAMAGTLVLGPAGDKIGRKPVFSLTAVIITVAGVCTAAATNYVSLLLLRFLVGFGVGGLTVPFDTLAEFVPTSHRGSNLLLIEYFWTAGTLLVPVFAYFSLGRDDPEEDSGWRFFVLLCAIPCLISTMLGLLFVPESPRWLLTQHKHPEALQVLRDAAVVNGKDPDQLFPIHTQLVDRSHDKEATLCDLWAPSWRRITFFLWISWVGLAFVYYGTIMAVTLVFADITNDSEQQGDSTNEMYSFDYAAIFTSASSELAGTTFVILLVDRIGRIRTQMISYFLGGISVLSLCLLAARNAPRGHLMVTAFFARLFFMGATCTTWVSTAEILTTEVRTTGHSFANAVGRLGGSASPFLVSSKNSFELIGIVLFIISFVTTFSTSQLPETRGKHLGLDDADHPAAELATTRSDGVSYDIV